MREGSGGRLSELQGKRVGNDGWKEEAERAECSKDGSSQTLSGSSYS